MNWVLGRVGLATIILASGCGAPEPAVPADAIYAGGDIITMDGDTAAYAEAVAVTGGKISFVGSKADADKLKGRATVVHDLKGRTLIPGLVDGHAHFTGFGAQAVAANLLASPDGDANSIDDIVRILKEWQATADTSMTNGWILGMGYDDAVLKEGRHPTKEDLDKVSTDVPVVIMHISGHFAVLNSKALELSKVTAASPDPAGGIIRRMPGSKVPNGVLEEMAAIPVIFVRFAPQTPKQADYLPGQGAGARRCRSATPPRRKAAQWPTTSNWCSTLNQVA